MGYIWCAVKVTRNGWYRLAFQHKHSLPPIFEECREVITKKKSLPLCPGGGSAALERPTGLGKMVRQASLASGRNAKPTQVRHSFASQYVWTLAGPICGLCRKILGHADISTTQIVHQSRLCYAAERCPRTSSEGEGRRELRGLSPYFVDIVFSAGKRTNLVFGDVRETQILRFAQDDNSFGYRIRMRK